MAIERIIGIDFGTSTSVVRVKTYKDNKPLTEKREADYVRFNNHNTVPTLIYETVDGKYFYGYEAENAAVKGELIQNFKLDLINTDANAREKAVNYTGMFINYLYKEYSEQSKVFPACDSSCEFTYVSYPAKWSEELREIMVSLVKKAGFKNVSSLDEPTAAVHTVMVQENDRLKLNKQGFANILMVDMGAGTTDLVLCRYDEKTGISILNLWPKAGSSSLMGGREIDEKLCDFVKEYLVNCGLPNTGNFKKTYMDKCRSWKETSLSPVLRSKDGVVRYCGFIDSLTSVMEVDLEFPPISRETFENMFKEYLSQLSTMVNECLDDAGFDANDVDYVILTGGHSQWYFTEEILGNEITKYGRVNLPKIENDKKRIIRMAIPQETVALGLVYQKLNAKMEKAQNQNWIYCLDCGTENMTGTKTCTFCGKILFDYKAEEPKQSSAAESVSSGMDKSTAAVPQTPIPNLKMDIFSLPPGKTVSGMINAVSNFLISKNMETQSVKKDDRSTSIQTRVRDGKWKQFVGMDVALTVTITQLSENSAGLSFSQSKWIDKGIVLASIFFLPLAFTSGVGMVMQGKLPGDIKKAVAQYLIS